MTTSAAAADYRATGHPVLLIADTDGPAADATQAVAQLGGRLLGRTRWEELAPRLAGQAARPVLLAEAIGVDAARLDVALPLLADQAAALDVPLIVSLHAAQIDQVAAALPMPPATLLCEPSLAERVAALAVAIRSAAAPHLGDSLREDEATRLSQLHDEVARIAEVLARLARAESDPAPGRELADRRLSFDPGPAPAGSGDVTGQEVRRRIQLRRLRTKFFDPFGPGMFEDPAWDMLLDLYAAELDGRQVSVSSLCIAAGVAPTTALRWIAKMTELGLFERRPDPQDRRRAFIGLSRQAAEAMRSYMLAARQVDGNAG